MFHRDTDNLNTHKEYYNDLPGKLAPDMLSEHDTNAKKNSVQKNEH